MYGADTLGTLFAADDEDAWNVARLVSESPRSSVVWILLLFYCLFGKNNSTFRQ